jgi:hypothetical protein
LPHNAATAATATPSPAATTHWSVADFITVGNKKAPETQTARPKTTAVNAPATNHLKVRSTSITTQHAQL